MENEETDPLLEHEEEKDDDDDDEETTNPFQPGGIVNTGEDIPLNTMNREKEKGQGIAETSFIEGSPLSRVIASDKKAWDSLTGIFPRCEGHRTQGVLQQNREVTSQNVWSKARGLILCLLKTKIQEDKG